MDPGNLRDTSSLDDLRDLLAGLGAELASGSLLGWASPGDVSDVPGEVYRTIATAGLLGEGDPQFAASVPANATALMSLLWEVDEPTAIGVLTSLTDAAGTPRAHQRGVRRRYQQDPRDIFGEIARLLGPGTQWWTNTDLTTWNPVTARPFDAVVAAAGNGVIVTLVAFEDGG